MSCVCSDNGLREFPSSLGCITTSGYGVTHEGDWLGFADEYMPVNEIVTAEVIIKTPADMAILAHWYYKEIAKGTLSFLIDIPIFGITRTWEVMMNGLNESLIRGNMVKNVKLTLEVITDISAVVDEEAGNLLCENWGG